MTKQMGEGQRSYEARRAAKAGVSLDKWLQMKRREQQEAERSRAQAATAQKPNRPGLLARLIERAHKPL